MYAYVGSRTTRDRNARGEGISVFRVDADTGALEPTQVVRDLVNPSFLALNQRGDRLYSVHGDMSDISAFAVDRASGRIEFINRQSTHGKNPVHLALDPTGKYIVVSNHIGASLAVLPLTDDGALGEMTQLVRLDGPIGPHRTEQKQAKPHFNPFDPSSAQLTPLQILPTLPDTFTGNSRAAEIEVDRSGRFLFASNRGHDSIAVFAVDPGTGLLRFAGADLSQGRTPRFFATHPNGRLLYALNEDSDTIVAFHIDPSSGRLSPTGFSARTGSPVCMVFSPGQA